MPIQLYNINLLAWTYVGMYVCCCECTDVLFSEFVCHFECLIFDQPHYNHTRTHKWNVYGYHMKQNVFMVPFTTYKDIHLTLQITSKIDFDQIVFTIKLYMYLPKKFSFHNINFNYWYPPPNTLGILQETSDFRKLKEFSLIPLFQSHTFYPPHSDEREGATKKKY